MSDQLPLSLPGDFDVTPDTVVPFEIPALKPKPGGLGMMRLRDYQCEAVDCIYESWIEHDALVAVLATGLGKTVVFSEVIIRWPGTGRILVLAHVQELILQAQKSIAYHTDQGVAIEMNIQRDKNHFGGKANVLVASVQTFGKRLEQFSPSDFDVLIIDEFHHAASPTYRRVWNWLKEGNPDAKLLGVTATPNRADNTSLACVADVCAFQMGIREGIDLGWLVPIQQKYVVVDELDFSKCRTLAKDINEKDLESAMMGGEAVEGMSEEERLALVEKQERMLHAVAAPAVKEAAGRQGIVYCVTVAHAERMAEILRRYPGVSAELIHGGTPTGDRKQLFNQFKGGHIQFLVNVGVVTEGVDVPGAQLIVMARPTKSTGLYTQMVGRATRPLPGLVDKYDTPELRQEAIGNSLKPYALVLDFVGNSGKHKLVSTADVLAGDMPEEFVEAAKAEMAETGEAGDIRAKAWQKKEEHDEEVRKRQEEEQQKAEARRREALAREEARRARLHAESQHRTKDVDPFDRNQVVAERPRPEFRGGSTDKQVEKLRRLGVSPETAMKWGKQQAGAVISDLGSRRGGKYILQFGKWLGHSLEKIPVEYLCWAGQNLHNEEFQANLEQFRQEWRSRNSTQGES